MFLLSTSFFRLSFVFVFVVVSFSLLSLGRDYNENNNKKHSARAPVQSEGWCAY